MPTPSLTYSVADIKKLIEEDAIRRGYTGVKVSLESYNPPRDFLMQQVSVGQTEPLVRGVVIAENITKPHA